MRFDDQGIIMDLKGIEVRLGRTITKFADLARDEESALDRLRAMSAKVESLIRVWGMADEQVGEEFLIPTFDRPRERILDLLVKELNRQLNGDWGRQLQEIRNEQEKQPEWIIEG